MRIQLPKPLHGWREFAGEVGVIVLGVLIALGLGEFAQAWNDRSNTRDARDAIRAEILLRFATEDCMAKRLNEIVDYLDARIKRKRGRSCDMAGQAPAVEYGHIPMGCRVAVGPSQLVPGWRTIGLLQHLRFAQGHRVSPSGRAEMVGAIAFAGGAEKWDTLRLAASQARYEDYQVRLFYGEASDDARAMGIEPLFDPSNVGPRSVCIPIRTPREEALRILHFRFGSP